MLQILVLFSCFAANSKTVCTLLEKNVDQRKYSFKCNDQIVNVQCKGKDEDICGVTIKTAIETMKFSISEDELESFNLFSTTELATTTCDPIKKLCTKDGNTCKKYRKFYKKAADAIEADAKKGKRCDYMTMGESVRAVGSFSGGLAADFEFNKNNCSSKSDVPFQALKNKIAILKKVIEPPLKDRDSLLYNCVSLSGKTTPAGRDSFVISKQKQLLDLKSRISHKLESTDELKGLACQPQNDIFFNNDKLDIETVMCAIIEESALSMSDKAISCEENVGNYEDTKTGMSIDRLVGAEKAKADTVPLESKPMPEVMTSQVGKPIGLTPALAQVDQAVPGSGTAQGVAPSEGNIATGAVRTISASAAMQAGQAFAPVYEKLSSMASSVSSSGRTSVIGRSNSPKINTDASGVVTVSRKLPSSDSRASVDPDALVAAAGSSGGAIANNIDGDSNKASKAAGLQRSTANNTDEVAPVGGPRPISLSSSRSAGGGPGKAAANVASGAANTEAVSSAALAAVQQKITELTTPAKIETFFKKEASNIADLRNLLYSDATSKLLAAKGIRVVNQSGDVSGESMTKAKYVYSDDGTKFTKLNIGKKN